MEPKYPPTRSVSSPNVVFKSDPPPGSSPRLSPPAGVALYPSDPKGLKSLKPMASSMRPMQSLFPSSPGGGGAARKRKLLVATVAGVGLGVVAFLGLHHGSALHTRKPLVADIASGKAGLRTTPSGAVEHWTAAAPPAFVLDPSLAKMGAQANAAIVDAFGTWDGANLGLPKASFTISSTPGKAEQDGVSRIVYAPITTAGFEDALAITIAYADGTSGEIGEADMIVNSAYTFGVLPAGTDASCKETFDVQDVVTHEAGHVYGLGEDYSDPTTTMFVSSEKCETHKRTLTTSDSQAMSALYASVAPTTSAASTSATTPPAAGCGASTIASRNPSPRSALWGLAAALVLGGSRRLRRRPRPERRP